VNRKECTSLQTRREILEEIIDRLKTKSGNTSKRKEIASDVWREYDSIFLNYTRLLMVPRNETKIRSNAKELSHDLEQAIWRAKQFPKTIEDLYVPGEVPFLGREFIDCLQERLDRSKLLSQVKGPSKNRNPIKGLCAHGALKLIEKYFPKSINGSRSEEHEILASLFHDAIKNTKGSDLNRACRAARREKDNPFLTSYMSTDIRRKLRKSVPAG